MEKINFCHSFIVCILKCIVLLSRKSSEGDISYAMRLDSFFLGFWKMLKCNENLDNVKLALTVASSGKSKEVSMNCNT